MEEIPEDLALRQSWNQLALAMERSEVFYTYEWAIAVQRTYRAFLAPLVFFAYEEDSLVGLVALAVRVGTGEVVFLATDTADYCDFLSNGDRRQEFLESVLFELKNRNIAKLALANLPADSLSVSALSSACRRYGYHLHSVSAYHCARVVLGSIEEREKLKQSLADKKRLRRNVRELEKRGSLTLQHDSEWEKIGPALQIFSRAHVARFLGTGRISNLIRPERRAFLSELARELSASGWICLSRLFVGATAAAWNYGFRFSGSWFWYQPTVNSRYGDFSPGYCLLAKIVEQACDFPDIAVVDLGLGEEEYKHRFATSNRLTLYCKLNQSFFRHFRSLVRHRAGLIAKASPRIERSIRAVIARLEILREHLRQEGLLKLMKWSFGRIQSRLFGLDKVAFFEWSAAGQNPASSTRLHRLDSDVVGAAAIRYADDIDTLRYLMRSAERIQSGTGEGFALLSPEGVAVHFCWVKDFEGFEMAELDRKLHAPSENAVMIFDCFTPGLVRGHGYFSQAASAVACHLVSRGKSPWISVAAAKQAWLEGIEKSAFTFRFSLGRKRFRFVSLIKDSLPSHPSERIA
jgi:CelD/BcsL family acetyltransferase involved in cellulose biosynthesis